MYAPQMQTLHQARQACVAVPAYNFKSLYGPANRQQQPASQTRSTRNLKNYQSRWVPLNEKINSIRIEPEQYTAKGYAFANMTYNSQYQPTIRIASSSNRYSTVPVQYGQGMQSFANPYANQYPQLYRTPGGCL